MRMQINKTSTFFSGAPPAGTGGFFPKRDIPRLAESIQPPAEAGGFLQRGKDQIVIRSRVPLQINDSISYL